MKSIHSLFIIIILFTILTTAGLLPATATAADDSEGNNQADIEFLNRWPDASPHTIVTGGDYVFVADGNMISVYDKNTLTLQNRLQIALSADDQIDKEEEIAGTEGVTALYYTSGILYAACGNEGLKIYDASDPADMTTTDDLLTTYIARESDSRVNIRDVVVKDNYAYIAYAKFGYRAYTELGTSSAGYSTGIQVLDVNNPNAPTLKGDHELSSVFGDMTEATSLCYWEGSDRQLLLIGDYYQGIHVIDVSTPATPVQEGMYYMGAVFDVDVGANGEYIYAAMGEYGVFAVEANLSSSSRFANGKMNTFPSEDENIYVCQYAGASSGAVSIDLEGNYAYVGDVDAGILVIDISDPAALDDVNEDTGQYTAVVGQFSAFDVGFNSKPAFFDLEDDGDLDAFCGTWKGNLYQFENAGAAGAPRFADPIDSGQLVTGACAPAFGDVDGDTNDDLCLGKKDGTIAYLKNTGAVSNPFEPQDDAGNPFSGIDVGGYAVTAFVDIDGDGDMDLFVGAGPDPDKDDGGANNGRIFFYENNDGADTFTEKTGGDNPLSGTDVPSDAAPAFVDIDDDGDFDCFIGAFDGSIYFYENTDQTAADVKNSPAFTKRTGANNPLDGTGAGKYFSAPVFVDIDDNNTMDCFIGYRDGFTHFYENTGAVDDPVFTRPEPDTLLTGEITGAYHLLADGNTLYVGDHLQGLQQLNISIPETPTLTTYVTDTATPSDGDAVFFNVNNQGIDIDDFDNAHLGSYAFVADDDATAGTFREGVRIFYAVLSQEFVTFIMKGYLATEGEAMDVFAHGDYLYVADGSGGLKIIDPDLPASSDDTKYRVEPELVGTCNPGWTANAVYVTNDYAYVAAGADGLRIVNVANAETPAEAGHIAGADVSDANDVYVSGNYAYVADGSNGVKVVDVSNPGAPALVGSSIISTADAQALSYSGTYLYLADGNEGFHIVDTSTPSSPYERGDGYQTDGTAYGIKAKYDSELDGDLIWIADGKEGLDFYVYYSTIPAQSFGSFNSSGIAKDVDVISSFAFISDGPGGLASIVCAPPDPAQSDLDTVPVNLHGTTYGGSSGCAIWTATEKGHVLDIFARFFADRFTGE
ncbi:MAG: FG-GAP-like repeat-containing protein [Thermodesulfobacteriota bacterium]|nr:FG-GAP-like repeat-containing protein [Thermodesulfobacteriota bacterium]